MTYREDTLGAIEKAEGFLLIVIGNVWTLGVLHKTGVCMGRVNLEFALKEALVVSGARVPRDITIDECYGHKP
jgi:hypothetical protein